MWISTLFFRILADNFLEYNFNISFLTSLSVTLEKPF